MWKSEEHHQRFILHEDRKELLGARRCIDWSEGNWKGSMAKTEWCLVARYLSAAEYLRIEILATTVEGQGLSSAREMQANSLNRLDRAGIAKILNKTTKNVDSNNKTIVSDQCRYWIRNFAVFGQRWGEKGS
ncbi:hypothetical protein AAHA92_02852 [Salvia divinorum]|uniref:Uncharacterized protein n=1 Tax=Salvia divinorum TaxID=28513 RepID=A0ABD1IG19_SALDI